MNAILKKFKYVALVSMTMIAPFAMANNHKPSPLLCSHSSAATFTSVNKKVDVPPPGGELCLNGPGNVNCNLYGAKEYVWLNGGPVGAALDDGNYYFVVVQPGGQNSSIGDGGEKNLSDTVAGPGLTLGGGDAFTNRTFSVTNCTLTYTGTHDFDPVNNKIRVMPFDDTPNNGGEYAFMICKLGADPGQPSDCKYDNFKIKTADICPGGCVTPPAARISVDKTADGAYDEKGIWTLAKSVNQTRIAQVAGSVTFTYTVTVGSSAGTKTNARVTGTITVTVSDGTVSGVSITDMLLDAQLAPDANASCGITAAVPNSLAPGVYVFPYACTFPANVGPATDTETNTVDVITTSPALLAGDAVVFDYAVTEYDDCVAVTDSHPSAGTSLGTVCYTGRAGAMPVSTTYTYARTIDVLPNCNNYGNTAQFTSSGVSANATPATGSKSATVRVCGLLNSGALTKGFWANKNGQAIIKGATPNAANCALASSVNGLRAYAPFQDLPAVSTCTAVAKYVMDVKVAADSSGVSMNKMLKAQMLATALDVYFGGGPGGNQINAPAPIGGQDIDLTKVCTDIGTCNNFVATSAAFGGATHKTVSELLTLAAGMSNVGGLLWYGNDKAMQELAKNTFDAINNQKAFGW